MISDTVLPVVGDARLLEIQKILKCHHTEWLTVENHPASHTTQCHQNVAEHIQRHQGTAQLGYNIMFSENSTKWTAIQHCVWRDNQQQLHDITPVKSTQLNSHCFIWGSTAKLFHNVFFDTVIVNYNYPIQRLR